MYDCRLCGASDATRPLELYTETGQGRPIPSYWRCRDREACGADVERDQHGWKASQ